MADLHEKTHFKNLKSIMKIALITINTPASENIGGTSALPYHLLVKRPADVEVMVYSFNYNNLSAAKIAEVEKELNLKIHLLNKSEEVIRMQKSKLGIAKRIFVRYPLHYYTKLNEDEVSEINVWLTENSTPNVISSKNVESETIKGDVSSCGVWIYGEELSQVSKQFAEYKRVHCFPDSESLYYKRMMEQPFVKAKKIMWIRQWLMYPKFARMEREMDKSKNIHYYLVGKADAENLRQQCPGIQAHFIRHPHYDIALQSHIGGVLALNENHTIAINSNNGYGLEDGYHKRIQTTSAPKLRLLIAGRYDLYMKWDAELMVEALIKRTDLQKYYVITILGKGWESVVVKLRAVGYEVNHITFAPDYIEEIRKHDIQVTPISIGTGTKGKVLDAMSNGLLVIGTWFALENIAVKDGESCLEYHSTNELMDILADIPMNTEKYKAIAEAGRKAVLTEHAREKCSEEMFDLFR